MSEMYYVFIIFFSELEDVYYALSELICSFCWWWSFPTVISSKKAHLQYCHCIQEDVESWMLEPLFPE